MDSCIRAKVDLCTAFFSEGGMRKQTTRRFCGYEITFERDKYGVVATAAHANDTIINGVHHETVADALYGMQQAIKSIERHSYPVRPDCPPELVKLYDKALHFLDKQSAVHDQYWAAGIVKAINRSFRELSEPVPTLRNANFSVRELAPACRGVVLVGSPPFPAIVSEGGQMTAKLPHIWHSSRRYIELHGYRPGPAVRAASHIATWFGLLKVPHIGAINLHQRRDRRASWIVTWLPGQ